jgi:hypothetical protein
MERPYRLRLWGVIALGSAICLVGAAVTTGDPFDMQSFRLVRDVLDQGALNVYAAFAHRGIVRWPYPPAFFPWIWAAGRLSSLGPDFAFFIRLPTIAADGAIAWLVQDTLGRCGHDPRTRLLGAAAVALGPSFIVIAGYHGQFDAVAFLPGVAAINLWTRTDDPWRSVIAGLLIGTGGALKTVPLLLVLALLPSARSRREGVLLILSAAIPVIVVFLPFAVAGTLPSAHVLAYRGLPGAGDLSLAAQPNLAEFALGEGAPRSSGLTNLLFNHGTVLIAAALVLVAVIGARSRARAPQMAALLWLAVYAFGINFFFQYLVWGLPFFLMAGYVRTVVALEFVLLPPTLLFYLRPWHSPTLVVVYAVIMIAAWLAALAAFGVLGWRLGMRSRPTGRPHSAEAAGEPGMV